jgi:hypothetical protein
MSFLKKSLEKRIQELRTSIDAQKTELAAYEQVLALESGKPAEGIAPAPAALTTVVSQHRKKATAPTRSVPVTAHGAPVGAEFNGSRSDFVASAIKERGSAGITPQEISAAFAVRKIAVSKNLVYNVLSLMFKQKRVRKSGGRYYHLAGKAAAPAAAHSSSPSPSSTVPKKSRISEEGMRRIIAATKKRWALQRAAKKGK